MKRITTAIIIMFLLSGVLPLSLFSLRSISTAKWDYFIYEDDSSDNGYILEEVAIQRLNDRWSIVGKAEYDERPYSKTLKGMGGVVFTLFDYSYMETSYGISVDNKDTIANHLLVDYYYERADYFLMLDIKAEVGGDGNSILPAGAVKWRGFSPLFLWGKYTTSFSDTVGFNNSFWGEADYDILPKFSLKAGGTIGTYHPDGDSSREYEYSGLGGVIFKPTGNISVKYLFEYLVRDTYDKVSNTIVADIRF